MVDAVREGGIDDTDVVKVIRVVRLLWVGALPVDSQDGQLS